MKRGFRVSIFLVPPVFALDVDPSCVLNRGRVAHRMPIFTGSKRRSFSLPLLPIAERRSEANTF